MFTPRRTLLLLAGFVLFGVAYGIYSRVLGWLDGLPQLPAALLEHKSDGIAPPPKGPVSPTQVKLALAFGPGAPETDYRLYHTQFEFQSGQSTIVIAAGPVPPSPKSKYVPLSPFSCAIFSKPKPAHLRQPGEVTEISTVHADKAILEFDREINNGSDMRSANLVRVELVSDFGSVAEDPRRGLIYITNNQRSADPNRHVVVRTPGPVFYRDRKAVAGTPDEQGPDCRTDAPVEIVDRQNLPRPIGAPSVTPAPSKSEDIRNPTTVADILAGRRSPPPTVTAIGFRLYLEPDPPPGQPKAKKNPNAPLQGVRRFEFLEQVVMNLWVDNKDQSITSSTTPAETSGTPDKQDKQSKSLALTPPPAALVAVTGGLGPGAYTAKLMDRALLQVETRGPFTYDSEKAVARFDVVPLSDPQLPNDVQVTKVSAREGTSSLFSQVLELELNGGPTTAERAGNASPIKRLHAWTNTPGRYLTVASQNEAMQAYGQDLVHDPVEHRTVLTGPKVHVVRERNVLEAGTTQRPATLTMESSKTPGQPPRMSVDGPGRVDLIDTSSSGTLSAEWQTKLEQLSETIDGRKQDLFVFTDAAKFEDKKSDYWLKGDVLRLWLESKEPAAFARLKIAIASPAPNSGNRSAKPSHVQAVGRVKSHSAEYDIEYADQLNVFFSDAKAPAPIAKPVSPEKPPVGQVASAPTGTPPPAQPVAGAKQPVPVPKEQEAASPVVEKPKPPMKIWAKDIQTWVQRVPIPADEKNLPKPDEKLAEKPAGTKYQLERVICEDNVVVQQAPTDPAKPRGIDIRGQKLRVDGSPDGNVLIVHGWPTRPAEVHQEEMSLLGPLIELNQLHNSASVKGRGALTMPTGSDLSGGEIKKPEVIVIQWRDEMDFRGALRSAKFIGKVSAQQGDSWLLCHTMHVTFDRAIYFNQMQKQQAKQADAKNPNATDNGKAKLDTVTCYPAPADSADDRHELFVHFAQAERDESGKTIKTQRLKSLELKILAQAQDPAGGTEKFKSMIAHGPGEYRVWQMGDKDFQGPLANDKQNPPAPMQGNAKPKPAAQEQEMKLTVVTFQGSMTAVDKGKVFQQATFTDDVRATNVPSESPNAEVQGDMLPPRALQLTCRTKLVVGTYKKEKGDTPPVQSMEATGNAYLRTDDYEGWAETIGLDDKVVRLTADKFGLARIKNRFGRGNDQSGKIITYDRGTGAFSVIESSGGSIAPKR